MMVIGETHQHLFVGRPFTPRALQDVSHPAVRVERGWKVNNIRDIRHSGELPKQFHNFSFVETPVSYPGCLRLEQLLSLFT